jgi:hypothetical protein
MESGEWHNTSMLLACVTGFVGLYNLNLNEFRGKKRNQTMNAKGDVLSLPSSN